jgi:dihydropteroate synthase
MESKDTLFSKKQSLNIRGRIILLNPPCIMGIINLTPDSFYEGSRFKSEKQVLIQCETILKDGGKIIDIGAYSSRPGADNLSIQEEKSRLTKVLGKIRKEFPGVIISVDTFRSEIALTVVNDYEVDMINDISAGTLDHKMIETIAALKIPYVLMHLKGSPQTMQQHTDYNHLIHDIILFLTEKINTLHQLGIADIIIDPGFGFAKNITQNYHLLANLHQFNSLNLPLLVGLSRKSMIYKLLNISAVESLNGTTALHTIALLQGADILRVHDVKEASETIRLVQEYKRQLNITD